MHQTAPPHPASRNISSGCCGCQSCSEPKGLVPCVAGVVLRPCRELFPQLVRVIRELAAFVNCRPQVRELFGPRCLTVLLLVIKLLVPFAPTQLHMLSVLQQRTCVVQPMTYCVRSSTLPTHCLQALNSLPMLCTRHLHCPPQTQQDLVLLPNATTGLNAVISSMARTLTPADAVFSLDIG